MASGRNIGGIALRMLCALALLFVFFAHQPSPAAANAAAANAPGALSAAYMLPDGTFADLCLSDEAHHSGGKTIFKTGCEVCRLCAGIVLPEPWGVVVAVADPVPAVFVFPRATDVRPPVLLVNAPPRGPPATVAAL